MTFKRWCVAALTVGAVRAVVPGPGCALAQQITYVSRNGSNVAYCGPLGSGPIVDHRFSMIDPTHDQITLSDNGGPMTPSSAAASLLDAAPSPTGIRLVGIGSAARGAAIPFGVSATADARDEWQFTTSEPVCFTLHVTLNAESTEGTAPIQSYLLAGALIPDPGVPPDAFSGLLIGPGTLERTLTGTLMPGQHAVSMQCRVEGTLHPFSGTFNTSISLDIGPGRLVTGPESTTACRAGTAAFSVASAGPGPISYAWQIEIPGSPGTWATLGNDPLPLGCGGSAHANPPDSADTNIGITPCAAVLEYQIRAVVTGPCGGITSDPATYSICLADWNCADGVDSQDFFDFLEAFFSGDADINGVDGTDSQDFFDFLGPFFSGC